MSLNISGGKQKQKSTTRELTPEERTKYYDKALSNMWGTLSGNSFQMPEYEKPTYQNPGEYTGLNSGDYEGLTKNLTDARLAAITSAWDRTKNDINQEMSDRGLYTSGIGAQKEIDLYRDNVQPAIMQAVAEGQQAGLNLQQNDLAARNAYNLQSAGQANTFNQNQAQTGLAAAWQPYQYLADLWNNTKGQYTKSSGSGWNFGFKGGGGDGGGSTGGVM